MCSLDLTYVLPHIRYELLSKKKVLKKRGAGGFFGPAVKNGQNYGPACFGLKMGEIQKFLFPQGFATLWPADG